MYMEISFHSFLKSLNFCESSESSETVPRSAAIASKIFSMLISSALGTKTAGSATSGRFKHSHFNRRNSEMLMLNMSNWKRIALMLVVLIWIGFVAV